MAKDKDRVGPAEAGKRWRARQRVALVNVALEVLADPRSNRHEAHCAREFLAEPDPESLSVDHLTVDQLTDLDALLDLVHEGTAGNVDMRGQHAPKVFESIVIACAACKGRRDADWINVAGLDEDSRAVLADTIAELRDAQKEA